MKNNLLVYRNSILPISETFVFNQSIMLNDFDAYLLGAKPAKVPRIEVPSDRAYYINKGSIYGNYQEGLFKFFGYIPQDVINWCKKLHPLLLHAHFGPDGVMALPLAEKLGIPLLVTFHGSDATLKDEYRESYYQKKFIRRRNLLINRTSLFIAVSDFIKNKLIEKGFPEEKIRLHYIGVDVDYFQNVPTYSSPPIILFVGRMVEKKGCRNLISAFRSVNNLVPESKLILIGEGTEKSSLEEHAKLILRQGSYEFLGAQSHESVKKWMNCAWVLCAPSVTDKSGDCEGLPIVILEAMASGLPVVSTFHAGIPEAVKPGKTGFLVEEKDEENLVNYLSKFIGNRELCLRMGRYGRERVENYFNLATQNRMLEQIYYETLQRCKARVDYNG